MECFSRPQDRAGEIRVIRRIRKVLRLQAKSIAALVRVAIFPDDLPIQKIAGVELNAGLRGPNFKRTSTAGFVDARRQLQAILLRMGIDHKIVIVSVAQHELLVVIVDARPDFRRRREIERGTFHRA